jgi:HAD superfamily phosphatase (TIGR01681 family)
MTDAPSSLRPAIAVAATFTADPVASALNFILQESGLDLDVKLAPYHQLFQQLLSRTSLLSANSQGVNVILVRIEDFVRDTADIASARALVARTTRELCDALIQYDTQAQSPSMIAVFMPSPAAAPELIADFEEAAATIAACARALHGIHLLDLKHIEQISSAEKYDPLRDELAHIPFTETFFASIALAIARKTHALRKPAHKVLVLDCDNTLWRGVVGEDGVDGVVIAPRFLDLQRFAVREQSTGTLVCLVSKNVEQDVLEVFSERSEMVLKTEHLVTHRINWKPKPENIVSLSRELNLGLDSFVFIDDNPIECAEVRAALPEVVTLNLPPEAQIPQFLENLWVFDKVSITVEDTLRTKMYRQNAARQSLESSTTDIGDFIASLGLVIDIAPPSESEWPRVLHSAHRRHDLT